MVSNKKKINQIVIKFCKENNLAFYDLYEVAGGENSRIVWFQNNLSHRDLIHFNQDGYYLQGMLFGEAFLRKYHEYSKYYK